MNVVKTFDNKAATDLSAKDGYCAKYDTGGMNVTSAITDQPVGIITKGGDTTKLKTEVCVFGEVDAVAGGTITAGQKITSHTDGTVVATAGASCTEFGVALTSAVAGDTFKVFVYGCPIKFA